LWAVSLTIRSKRLATLAFFNHTLLTTLVYNEVGLAHPQAGELMAVRRLVSSGFERDFGHQQGVC
jgi:hypothetical protein